MTQTLYDKDFYAWTQQQAELIRHEELEKLDLPNILEEIESMGKSQQRELDSRLTRIIEHLLKLTYEPHSRAERGWKGSVLEQRIELKKLLRDNSTLRATVGDYVEEAYQDACKLAADGLELAISTFPPTCPWSVEQILDTGWLPE